MRFNWKPESKERYFRKAEAAVKAAGFDDILRVDRDQFSVVKGTVKVHFKPISRDGKTRRWWEAKRTIENMHEVPPAKDQLLNTLESADMLRIIKGGEEMFVGYLALFAPEVGHTNCKLYEQYKFDKVVKFRAVPEITHRKWKELNLMSPLRPDETPDFKFQELQMKLYYTIYL